MNIKEVKLTISADSAPTRADSALTDALRAEYPALSRKRVKEWMEQGRVRLVEKSGSWEQPSRLDARTLLSTGQYFVRIESWSLNEGEAARALPSRVTGGFLPVVYEDEQILLLHKTTGTPSLPIAAEESETAVGSALARCPSLAGEFPDLPMEPGLLHRIDTATSGLLLFAKSRAVLAELRRAWRGGPVEADAPAADSSGAKRVRKIYRAVVTGSGPFPNPPFTIRHPIARRADTSRRVAVITHPSSASARKTRGKPMDAITHVLEARELQPGVWDVTVEIETGVMHQIRAHLAASGWPILGDPIYGKEPPDAGARLHLHAWKLSFSLIYSAGAPPQDLAFEAALPEGWPC